MAALKKNIMLVSVFALFVPGPMTAVAAAQDLRALLRQRIEAARRAYKESNDLYREGRTRDVDRMYRWSQRLLEAELEASTKKSDQIAALEAHWKRMKQLEDLVRNVYKAGAVAQVELPAVEYYRLDAEIALSKARAK
jgi:outer membrane protein TolC